MVCFKQQAATEKSNAFCLLSLYSINPYINPPINASPLPTLSITGVTSCTAALKIVLPVDDSTDITDAFAAIWKSSTTEEVVEKTLANVAFWDEDLTAVSGLQEALVRAIDEINSNGIEVGFENFSKQ